MFGWFCAFSFEAFEHRWQHNVQHFNGHRGFVQTFGERSERPSSSQSPSFSSWPHFHCFHLFQCSLESWVAVWGNNMYSALTISRNLLLSTTETFLQPKWANTKNLEPINYCHHQHLHHCHHHDHQQLHHVSLSSSNLFSQSLSRSGSTINQSKSFKKVMADVMQPAGTDMWSFYLTCENIVWLSDI